MRWTISQAKRIQNTPSVLDELLGNGIIATEASFNENNAEGTQLTQQDGKEEE